MKERLEALVVGERNKENLGWCNGWWEGKDLRSVSRKANVYIEVSLTPRVSSSPSVPRVQ